MRWFGETKNPKWVRCVIEYQKLHNQNYTEFLDAYYLYVYDENGEMTHDHMQDSLEIAKKQANRECGIPFDAWVENKDPFFWKAEIETSKSFFSLADTAKIALMRKSWPSVGKSRKLTVRITHDLVMGFYLTASEEHLPIKTWGNDRYRNKNTLEELQTIALEDFGVPMELLL